MSTILLVMGSINKRWIYGLMNYYWRIFFITSIILVKNSQAKKRSMRSFPDFEYKSLTKHWSDFFTYHGLFAILYFRRFYTILHFPKPCIASHKNSNYPKGIKLCKECEYFVMEGGDPRLYLFRILNKAVAVGVTSVHSLYSTNIRLNW